MEKVREMREQLSRAIARRSVDGFLLGVQQQITEGIEPHGYSPASISPNKDNTWAVTSLATYTGAGGETVVRFCFVPINQGELLTTEVNTLIAKFLDQMGRTLAEEELTAIQEILAVLEQLMPEKSILARRALYKFATIFRKTGLLAMQNYLSWAEANEERTQMILATVMHDLNGCAEPFFEPHTGSYLTEARDDH